MNSNESFGSFLKWLKWAFHVCGNCLRIVPNPLLKYSEQSHRLQRCSNGSQKCTSNSSDMLQIKRHGLYALRSSQSPTQRSLFTTANNSSQTHPKRYSSIKWHKSANYRFTAIQQSNERRKKLSAYTHTEREALQINISL